MIQDVILYAGGLLTVLNLGILLRQQFSAGAKANARKIEQVENDLQSLTRRVDRHGDQIGHLPTVEKVHDIEVTLAEIKGQIGQIHTELKPLGSIVDRIQDAMMKANQ